ncbi:50S ribosomal protein L32 [Candidatus Falkowbacteria bacterium RIFOXYD2_FULL_35_9]|uniref:Large ribosomal subunit protein bL32 n=1 Tax=Candidatus Falkowbacteria bacterium RIFOXYC2_FULL_36_12 TaxID=1798002 RepID=A0A1F5T372_9BACT|nr:MAG: 50S ribosomal protein L32 [Candidatus Falkowbacteria bacterium RIFOXYA2_FULL_35_8]OGF33400.1 MAG: 50S ribosomal protein L32 [Candidatus Falkowbacteria bacterium RIFOXYC2_FULL_36_12]OGF46534.1 MAG: 50S ribosomal protein L32 [Candidatus Falkowbacteria bacterium RIFOXYD2_FULL_35_9]
MSVPKRRKTSSKTKKGRSHQALKNPNYTKCPKCGASARPHYACIECGSYNSREVLKTRATKKAGQKAKKEAQAKKAQKTS